jgi:hypothetical protein
MASATTYAVTEEELHRLLACAEVIDLDLGRVAGARELRGVSELIRKRTELIAFTVGEVRQRGGTETPLRPAS